MHIQLEAQDDEECQASALPPAPQLVRGPVFFVFSNIITLDVRSLPHPYVLPFA